MAEGLLTPQQQQDIDYNLLRNIPIVNAIAGEDASKSVVSLGMGAVSFNPSADTSGHIASPNNNFGNLTENAYAGDGATSNRNNTFIKFDLAGLQEQNLISAVFNFKSTSILVETKTANFQMVNTPDWVESVLTWNNMPTSMIGSVKSATVSATDTWYTVDITDFVDDWIDGTQANYGMRLTTAGNEAASIYSKESSGNEPYLELTYDDTKLYVSTARFQCTVDRIVGFVDGMKQDTNSETVKSKLVTGLSGLTAGEMYKLQDDGTFGTSAGTIDKNVFVAKTTTDAILLI